MRYLDSLVKIKDINTNEGKTVEELVAYVNDLKQRIQKDIDRLYNTIELRRFYYEFFRTCKRKIFM